MSTVTITVTATVSTPQGNAQTQETFSASSFAECRKALSGIGKHLRDNGYKCTPDSRVDFTARKVTYRNPSDWTSYEVIYQARYDDKPSKLATGKSYTIKGLVADEPAPVHPVQANWRGSFKHLAR